MSKRKTGLTIAEHRQVAGTIRRVIRDVHEVRVLLGKRYSLAMSDKYYHLQNKFLETLRCELDSYGFKEHRDQFSTQVYYGPGPDHEQDNEPSEIERLRVANAALTAANLALQTRVAAQKYQQGELHKECAALREELEDQQVKYSDRIGEIELEHQLETYGLQGKIERLRDGMQALMVPDPDDLF
jgi:hypothetical protein